MCDAALFQMASVVVQSTSQASTYKRNARSAYAAEADAMAGLSDRMYQEGQAVTDQMVERSRQAARDVGTLNAIFADSGLSGNSQDRVVAETAMAADADLTTMGRNRSLRINQGNQEAAQIRAQTTSRVNSVARPSLLGSGLQIAGYEIDRRNPRKH